MRFLAVYRPYIGRIMAVCRPYIGHILCPNLPLNTIMYPYIGAIGDTFCCTLIVSKCGHTIYV